MYTKQKQRWLARLFLILLLCSSLGFSAAASDSQAEQAQQADSMEQVVAQLCEAYGLNEENFSLCYYNTITKESYSYNPDAWMIAGSTYKLPLNMYYYEQEAAGAIDPEQQIAGHSLSEIHYQSIVYSNNELSEALIDNLGSFQHYKELMFSNYGGLEPEEINDIVWTKNYFTTRYMLNTLKYLYANADQFSELLSLMREAAPDAYFKKYVTEYEIAHKYGSYDTAENDVGIVYTHEPYLLAVYTYQLPDGEDIVGRINEAVCAYNVAHLQTPKTQEEPTQEAPISALESEQYLLAATLTPESASGTLQELLPFLPLVLIGLVLLVVVLLLIRHHRKKHQSQEASQ